MLTDGWRADLLLSLVRLMVRTLFDPPALQAPSPITRGGSSRYLPRLTNRFAFRVLVEWLELSVSSTLVR
jgi:hypothetical protein